MRNLNVFFCALFLLTSVLVQAQDADNMMKQGTRLFKEEKYRNALPFFEKVIAAEPDNAEAYYNAGICYLNRYSREKALTYLLKAKELDTELDKHLNYWLGRAYHQNYKFDEAIAAFEEYSEEIGKFDQRQKDITRYIDQCKRAKEYLANPKNYLVANLGPNVNTSFSEHSPVTSSNDSTIMFTSRRESTDAKEELDGEPFEDVFISKLGKDSTWSKPESIHLNTTGHDASVQLYDNDKKLIIYKFTRGGDIYVTERDGDKWTDPKPLANINTRDFEADAFVTADGNSIYYATNHYKKIGDLDIYFITKDANGNWGKPQELKGNINTGDDEDAPFISPDGKTLYFSSRGHDGIGGFDVYRSVKDANGKWSDPENLGYPINTPGDDVYYYLSAVKNRGYLASYREGGYGEKDIYSIQPIPAVKCTLIVKEDKTEMPVDGATVQLTSLKKTTTASSATVNIIQGTGSATVMSYNRYKAVVLKGKDTLLVQEFEVPIAENEGETFTQTLVVPFTGNPEDTVTAKPPVDLLPAPDTVSRIIYFAPSQSLLSTSATRQLKYVKNAMLMNPLLKIEIIGHADSQGPDDKNMILSENRAKAAYQYLLKHGIDASRIKVASVGETMPLGDNNTPEGRAKNRRVEIRSVK